MGGYRIGTSFHRLIGFLGLFFALPVSLHAQSPRDAIPAGLGQKQAGDFEWEFRHAEKSVRVLAYRPKAWNKGPVLVLFHGASRNAGSYRQGGRILADQLNMLLLVPEFDRERFDPQAYQEGGVFCRGKLQAAEDRTFAYIPALLAEANRRAGRKLPYYLVGHSAGAQFVGRLAALLPNDAERLVVVNPSAFVLPDLTESYPFGFGRLPAAEASDVTLKRYLAAPLTLYLGTGDTGTQDLDVRPAAMRQGATRIERGRNAYAAARRLAEEKGWPFRWEIVEAEGLGHGSVPMWQHPKMKSAILSPKK